jgi:hypothetical protein
MSFKFESRDEPTARHSPVELNHGRVLRNQIPGRSPGPLPLWNELADQPHNVAPRSERTRHHVRHWRTYVSLVWANVLCGPPAYFRYRRLKKQMFRRPVAIGREMFAVAVSPRKGRNEEVAALLEETGVRETLVRIPSWEKDRLGDYEDFARLLHVRGMGLTFALLQRREDVFDAAGWARFVEDCFARLGPFGRDFEIGHAWNRTKWGVWDYTEYLALARPAFALRDKYGVRLIGPAVIDFEFHLYPPTLRILPFDTSSSLLYVDRVGAPENAQFGWTAAMKVALFKAYTEVSARRPCGCRITEVNWPLADTGPYSPASGKPNVSEEEQADYLVRYYLICLAGGLIERVYWWQLVAPGYGLVDSREEPWRRRPSWFALRTMVAELAGAEFAGKDEGRAARGAEIYRFRKAGREFAVCWTNGAPADFDFGRPVARVLDRDGGFRGPGSDRLGTHWGTRWAGRESAGDSCRPGSDRIGARWDGSGSVKIERSPKYVFFG